jgi:ubiquinone/menaquinone biosynthesis C-methylase UbiE
MSDGKSRRIGPSTARQAFARQARAYSMSPLQTDPARLARLVEFVRPLPGERALDLACGPGIVAAALERAGLLVTGIDLTREMLREAAARGGRCVQGNADRLPFPDRTFDVAVCRNSFHHFPAPRAVMDEMGRVLRPGGRAIVEDMCAPEDPGQRDRHETIERLRDVSHAATLTRAEFFDLAAAAGFAGFESEPLAFVIEFDEWIDRAYPSPENRRQARLLMEGAIGNDVCGLRVFREDGLLKFERRSLIWRAVRPA